MPEILLFLGIIGIISIAILKKAYSSLELIDYCSGKNFPDGRINNFKSWMKFFSLVVILSVAPEIVMGFSQWNYLNSVKSHWLTSFIEIGNIVAQWGVFLLLIFFCYLYVKNLVNRTSPSVAWRVILLYCIITLCCLTGIGLIFAWIFSMSESRGRARSQWTAFQSGAADRIR
jgi:hypothetical protein